MHAPSEFKIVRLRETPVQAPLDSPPQIFDYWQKHITTAPWYDTDKECFCVLLLNTRHNLIGFNLVSLGGLNSVGVHPREVFRPAIIGAAASIIIGHNHPSGDPTPSQDDIKVTRDLVRAGQLLKIDLIDHLIIADHRHSMVGSYKSLRELGYIYQ